MSESAVSVTIPSFRKGSGDPWQKTRHDYARSLRTFCLPIPAGSEDHVKSLVGRRSVRLADLGLPMETESYISMLQKRTDPADSSVWFPKEMPEIKYLRASVYPSMTDTGLTLAFTIPESAKVIDWLGYPETGPNMIEWPSYSGVVEWIHTLGMGEPIDSLIHQPESGVLVGASLFAMTLMYYGKKRGFSGVMPNSHEVLLHADLEVDPIAVLDKDHTIKRLYDFVSEAVDRKLLVHPLILAENGMMSVTPKNTKEAVKSLETVVSHLDSLIGSMRMRSRSVRQDVEMDYLSIAAVAKAFSALSFAAMASNLPVCVKFDRIHSMFPGLLPPGLALTRRPEWADWPEHLVMLMQGERAVGAMGVGAEKIESLKKVLGMMVEPGRHLNPNTFDQDLEKAMIEAAGQIAEIPKIMGSTYCGDSLKAMMELS